MKGVSTVDLRQAARRAQDAGRTARVLAHRPVRSSGALVFAYHDIVETTEGSPEYAVDARSFRRQLEMTTASGHRFVTLGEIVDRIRTGAPIDGMAAVTFDDALEGVRRHAAPIVADLGVPATVFVVTDALGQQPAWWPAAGPVMGRDGLDELVAAGMHLGSHTLSHPSLPTLAPDGIARELRDSKAELEAVTGTSVDHLAYPFGHFSPTVREAARDAGYTAAFTFLNGRTTPGLDRFRLPRLTVGDHHGAVRMAYHLVRSPASWPDTQLEEFTGA